MNIGQRDRDVDFFSCYTELDNPNALRAKKSSNMMFLGCAAIIAVMLLLVVLLRNQNAQYKEEIETNRAYIENVTNKEAYDKKMALQERNGKIKNYNTASETFLTQLQKSDRFSSEWVTFYDNAMQTAIGAGNKITTYNYNDGMLLLDCTATNADRPKLFAQYLTELKNDQGQKKFENVTYTGFAGEGNEYNFTLEITLWPDIAKEAADIAAEQAAAASAIAAEEAK
ncbi:MAG: hypothetical protein RR869_08870 [Lachnospiraceae bacterium]